MSYMIAINKILSTGRDESDILQRAYYMKVIFIFNIQTYNELYDSNLSNLLPTTAAIDQFNQILEETPESYLRYKIIFINLAIGWATWFPTANSPP